MHNSSRPTSALSNLLQSGGSLEEDSDGREQGELEDQSAEVRLGALAGGDLVSAASTWTRGRSEAGRQCSFGSFETSCTSFFGFCVAEDWP